MIPSRIEAARKGENPAVVCRMPSGWAVLCEWQGLPGYIILLADPVVASLNDLDPDAGLVFLRDMRLIGDALLEVTDSHRINYEILCNVDPYLHAHIAPRYEWEEESGRTIAPTRYNWSFGPHFNAEVDQALMREIREAIEKRLPKAGD